MNAISIEELKVAARRRLPRAVFDFVDGGAQDERTLRSNEESLASIRLMTRVMVDVERRSQAVTVLGQTLTSPLVLAPTGLAGLLWPHGESMAAAAARQRGAEFCLSTMSTYTIEQVAAVAPGFWFQLYMMGERAVNADLIRRARDAGCRVLCVTVDLPVSGARERERRNGLSIHCACGRG